MSIWIFYVFPNVIAGEMKMVSPSIPNPPPKKTVGQGVALQLSTKASKFVCDSGQIGSPIVGLGEISQITQ